MDTLIWILALVVAVAIVAGLFVAFRRRQRSGDILAASGPGTSKEVDE